jgi:hypothetical protein
VRVPSESTVSKVPNKKAVRGKGFAGKRKELSGRGSLT